MNEPHGQSLKELYHTNQNKDLLWFYMRYFNIYYEIKTHTSWEIHIPRNSKEIYTYCCDRFWAKIIHGINHMIEYPDCYLQELQEVIHLGSRYNLIYYWYPILIYNKNTELNYSNEIKYYLYSLDMALELKNKNFHNFLSEDVFISEILYNIEPTINKNKCIELLKNLITNYDQKLIDRFYNYLTGNINDPCIETENRDELVNIILSYY